MLHVVIRESDRIRHEYWEQEKYNMPVNSFGRHPYYVCYTYN